MPGSVLWWGPAICPHPASLGWQRLEAGQQLSPTAGARTDLPARPPHFDADDF